MRFQSRLHDCSANNVLLIAVQYGRETTLPAPSLVGHGTPPAGKAAPPYRLGINTILADYGLQLPITLQEMALLSNLRGLFKQIEAELNDSNVFHP